MVNCKDVFAYPPTGVLERVASCPRLKLIVLTLVAIMFTMNFVDGFTRLLRFVTYAHLPFCFRSLDSLFQALCQWRIEKAGGRRVESGREKGEARRAC